MFRSVSYCLIHQMLCYDSALNAAHYTDTFQEGLVFMSYVFMLSFETEQAQSRWGL